jgi:hypothetical protein
MAIPNYKWSRGLHACVLILMTAGLLQEPAGVEPPAKHNSNPRHLFLIYRKQKKINFFLSLIWLDGNVLWWNQVSDQRDRDRE